MLSADADALSTAMITSARTASLSTNRRRRGEKLRREPAARPPAVAQLVLDAIVQPRRLALPQLDRIRNHAIAAPIRRPRDRALAPLARLRDDGSLEHLTIRNHLRLRRHDRADLTAARPRREVRV